MNKLLLLAGAAMMAATAPAIAKPGHGQGHGPKAHATAKAHGHAVKHSAKGTKHVTLSRRLDRNRNGLLDRDERLARQYGGALCPPGLYKKNPRCIPPGQAKRDFREGQRLPGSYRYYTPYGDIPLVLRDRYDLSDDYRYIYRNNTIYVVDPQTSLISRIIAAVL